MKNELVVKAQEKAQLFRLKGGRLMCPRYTFLNAVCVIWEFCGDKDYVRISLDEWARTFHGTSSKTTRDLAKQQIRRIIPQLMDEGWSVAPDYKGRELDGLIYAQNIPDDDDEGIVDLFVDRIETAEHRRDLTHDRLQQMRENLRRIVGEEHGADEKK